MSDQTDHLDRAIKIMNGLQSACQVLKLKNYQTLQQWRVTRVPAGRCPDIEAATGGAVTCEELRPDINWAVVRAGHPKLGAGVTTVATPDTLKRQAA